MRSEISLNEAMVSTHSDGHINPSRDGVFARVRNIFHQNGIPLAIGSVVGLGGFEIGKKKFNETITTEAVHATTSIAITTPESSKNSKNNNDEITERL